DEWAPEATTLARPGVFQTKNEVIMMPGSGQTALETGALSVIEPGDRVLVVGAGQFGILMREIMNRTGADWTEFPVEWGARLDLARLQREAERTRPKAITLVHNETSTGTTYPAAEVGMIARSVGALFLLDTVSSIAGIDVRTDEWGVDLNMTGSQKCLAAPLGMALVAVSPRAWEVMERRSKPARSFAYDLLRWKEWWVPVSNAVSCLRVPRSIEPAAVVTQMRDRYGILIGTGLDKMRTTTLRIGTMGLTASPQYVLPTLSALELALRDLGYKCEPGAGVAAAQAAFADAG